MQFIYSASSSEAVSLQSAVLIGITEQTVQVREKERKKEIQKERKGKSKEGLQRKKKERKTEREGVSQLEKSM